MKKNNKSKTNGAHKFISFPIFMISLAAGLFMVYITEPKKELIYVYPTPENSKKIQYQDRMGSCYQYESIEVECPKDRTQIENYEAQ